MEPAADAQPLPSIANNDLFDRVVASSRLNFEEDELAPIHIHFCGSLGSRYADFFPRSNRIELERTSPSWIPAFEEGAIGGRAEVRG